MSSKAGPPGSSRFCHGWPNAAVSGSNRREPHLGGRQMAVEESEQSSESWKKLAALSHNQLLSMSMSHDSFFCNFICFSFLRFHLFLQILATTRARIDGEIHKIVGQVHLIFSEAYSKSLTICSGHESFFDLRITCATTRPAPLITSLKLFFLAEIGVTSAAPWAVPRRLCLTRPSPNYSATLCTCRLHNVWWPMKNRQTQKCLGIKEKRFRRDACV